MLSDEEISEMCRPTALELLPFSWMVAFTAELARGATTINHMNVAAAQVLLAMFFMALDNH